MLNLQDKGLQQAVKEIADQIAQRLMPPVEPLNIGPYKVTAWTETSPSRFRKYQLREFDTLLEIAQKAAQLPGWWFDVADRDGKQIASLDFGGWYFLEGVENVGRADRPEEIEIPEEAVTEKPDQHVNQEVNREFVTMAKALVRAGQERHKQLHYRMERALHIVIDGRWQDLGNGAFEIPSLSRLGRFYSINGSCECEYAQRGQRDSWCSHQLARGLIIRVREELARERGEEIPPKP